MSKLGGGGLTANNAGNPGVLSPAGVSQAPEVTPSNPTVADTYRNDSGVITYSSGSYVGTIDDCKKIAGNVTYNGYTNVEFVPYPANSSAGADADKLYVPSQCGVRVKGKYDICYFGRFDWYNSPKGSDGISTANLSYINSALAADCNAMPGNQEDNGLSQDHHITIRSVGVSLPFDTDDMQLYVDPGTKKFYAEPINKLVAEMNKTATKKFKGVFEKKDGTGTQYMNADGTLTNNQVTSMHVYYMVWE